MLVKEELNIEASRGEIRSVAFNVAQRSLHLEMEDTTGVVNTADTKIEGLPAVEYRVRTVSSELHIPAATPIRLSIPIEEAASITLQN
jgi:hypothetical protein